MVVVVIHLSLLTNRHRNLVPNFILYSFCSLLNKYRSSPPLQKKTNQFEFLPRGRMFVFICDCGKNTKMPYKYSNDSMDLFE